MSLVVNVSGYGICDNDNSFYLVICAQQENFQAWTVYRRTEAFTNLAEQLNAPMSDRLDMNGNDLSHDNMERCRAMSDQWLQMLVQNPNVLRTPIMYQFLCADANCPPANCEIFWVQEEDDEMDMDDMFEGPSGNGTNRNDLSDGRTFSTNSNPSVFGFRNSDNGKFEHDMEDDDDDDIDIRAVESAELEYYDPNDDPTNTNTGSSNYNNEGKNNHGDGNLYDNGNGSNSNNPKTKCLDEYKIIKVIGKGSFGKVFLVREKKSELLFAMKVLKKDYIVRKNQVEHTRTERSVLGYINHPYIVGLSKAFQTKEHLYFILDYCAGGELFFQLGKVGRFEEHRAKFYAAQIILALEYMHSKDIIYRDLKPENVLLDEKGNIRITDFGLSKEGVNDSSAGANSFCGTPEYIAPEVLNRKGHGRAVDWWSLGALLYEMMTGLPPFYSRNREVMFEKIMKAELTFPPSMNGYARDLLSRLLVRDPRHRLGSGEKDAGELREHPFFNDIDWDALRSGKISTPWVPHVAGSLDTSQFDQEFTSMRPIVSPGVREAYFGSLDSKFEGFSFVDESTTQQMMMSSSVRSGAATMMASLSQSQRR